MRTTFYSITALMALLVFSMPVRAEEDDPYDQSKVPLEVEPPADNKLPVIVLVAGSRSHGPGDHEFFAGTALLMNMLKQNGVFPIMARNGWPKNPKIFDNAKSMFFFMDGGGGHPVTQQGRMEMLQPLIDKGVGFVCAHYAVEFAGHKNEQLKAKVLKWLGGYYETGWSINPHWDADYTTFPMHPITQGVKPFKANDEWYYNMRWDEGMKGVTPILKATPPDKTRGTPEAKAHPGREEIMAWAFERPDGGRSFGFTGGHKHKNWGDENFRRLVVNSLLWSAKIDIPSGGAKVELDPKDLNKNMDDKRPKPKPAPVEKKTEEPKK